MSKTMSSEVDKVFLFNFNTLLVQDMYLYKILVTGSWAISLASIATLIDPSV
jgi:hypothetical protein